jgi:hypothetical protein
MTEVIPAKFVLLDGSQWSYNELLERMSDDEFYYGYLGKASLSSSSVKLLNQSPKAYQRYLNNGSESSSALTNGKLLHMLILEPNKVQDSFEIVDVKSKLTKSFKDAEVANPGKLVITGDEFRNAQNMMNSLMNCKRVEDIIMNCSYEKADFGYVAGMPFRAKADMVHEDGSIYDLKTTSDIEGFRYSAKKYGYASQVYIYGKIFGVHYLNFHFIVIDKTTQDVGIYSVSEEFYKLGEQLVKNATKTYREYFIENKDINQHLITEIL